MEKMEKKQLDKQKTYDTIVDSFNAYVDKEDIMCIVDALNRTIKDLKKTSNNKEVKRIVIGDVYLNLFVQTIYNVKQKHKTKKP